MKVLDQMMGIVISMQGDIKEMKEKIEAIQNNEASVFDPNTETLMPKPISVSENIAQEGAGAIQ